jgi:hypothetical protein
MSVKDEILDFEKKLETAIKSAFRKVIEEDVDFDISADYDTHRRLDKIVKGLDLEVYGMKISPSEFTITFEFSGAFQMLNINPKPRYFSISLQNDGDYDLTISVDDLERDWYPNITDFNFNVNSTNEEAMANSLKLLNHQLVFKILSN